jgi:hypothetical protein
MKTILIPTDFNVESAKIIDAFIITQKTEAVKLIFVHAFKLSDSISDMLMLSRRSRDYEIVSDEFYTVLNQYKTKYQNQIKTIAIEYFYGSTVVAFKNFIEAHQVDTIIYPTVYNFCPINKYSIDPRVLTARSGCQLIELDINAVTAEENLYETKIVENAQSPVNV